MFPGTYAAQAPDRIAVVMTGTGETLSYGDLERRSVQLAHVLYEAGLRAGDVVALLTENNLRAFEVYWAALRSGLYITPPSTTTSSRTRWPTSSATAARPR